MSQDSAIPAFSIGHKGVSGGRPRPRQQRSIESVERILNATSRVLARVPLTEVTTTQVAREAGVSIGGLYRFFPDRQSLIDAVAVRGVSEFAKLLERDLLNAGFTSPATFIASVVDAYVDFLDTHPDFRQIALGKQVSSDARQAHVGPDIGVTGVVKRFLTDRFGFQLPEELDLRLNVANEVGERLIAFAYEQPSQEKKRAILAEMKRLLTSYVTS